MKRVTNDDWCKRANIAMILAEKDTGDIAKDLEYSRQFVSGVINGNRPSYPARMRISHYLGIRAESDYKALQTIKNVLANEKSM